MCPPQKKKKKSFAYHIMKLCCVYFSKANDNDIQKGEQVGETCRVLLFIKMSRIYRYCLKPDCEALPFWQEKCKVLERCLQISSLCSSSALSFDFERGAGKKRRRRRKKKNLPTSLSSDNTLPMWHLTFGDFPFSLIIHCLDHVN